VPHPKDNEIYPIGSRAIWTRPSHRVTDKVVEVIITGHCFQYNGEGFLNYEVEMVNDRGAYYAAYHDDLKIIS